MAELTLYTNQAPEYPDQNDGETARVLATTFKSSIETYAVGARWRTPTGGFPPAAKLSLWSLTGDAPNANTGTRLAIEPLSFAGVTLGDWAEARWAPILIPPDVPRVVQVWIQGGRYVYSWGGWPINNFTLHGYDEVANGRWSNTTLTDDILAQQHYPGGSNYNYLVDIITDPAPASGRNPGPDFLPFF